MTNTGQPIIGVAVRFGDLMVCLPKPSRHCHCFWKAREIGIELGSSKADDQGFYLADGTFLNRSQAFEHVKMIGQPLKEVANLYLFSENLW